MSLRCQETTKESLKPKGLENHHQVPLEIAGVQGQTPRKKPVKEHRAGIKEGDKQDVLEHCNRIRQLVGLKDRHSLGRACGAQKDTTILKTIQAEAHEST